MTRERLDELWPVMEHFKGGGAVQRMGSRHDTKRDWFDDPSPTFSDPSGTWRIKPAPKLAPLGAEDWLHVGPWWVRYKGNDHAMSVLEVRADCMDTHRGTHSHQEMMDKMDRRSASDPLGEWLPCSKLEALQDIENKFKE